MAKHEINCVLNHTWNGDFVCDLDTSIVGYFDNAIVPEKNNFVTVSLYVSLYHFSELL